MKKIYAMINEEKGSAIVLAIMILVIASIIGIESASTSSMEVQISASERDAKLLFYKAEGAAMQAAQEIENADPDDLIEREESWLNDDNTDLLDESQWDTDNAAEGRLGDNTAFGVVDAGVDAGTSLDMGSSQLHRFMVYGRCEEKNQSAFIEMGYKRRF